ncbi:hypothetical protein AALB16_09105 [Lachnospiraceae bacterium 62-35]
MEITMTSRMRPSEVHSSSPKTSPDGEKEKALPVIQQDTYESSLPATFHTNSLQSASKDGHFLQGEFSPVNQLKTADFQPGDDIDWSWVKLRMSGSVTLDNADSLIRQIDTISSTYVAVKSRLQQTYEEHDDKLAENMEKLESMFTQAKQRITSSYRETVGNFYEKLGNTGTKHHMGESLSLAIDRKVQEMENTVKESGILERTRDSSFHLIELSLDVKSLNEQKDSRISASATEKGTGIYSLNDLQAAGMIAKAASAMSPKELQLMNHNELGIHLAVQYMKAAEILKHCGIGKEMSDFLKTSFDTYLDKYASGALSDKDRAFHPYHEMLKQYESNGNILQALEQTGKKYLGDSFFHVFQKDKNGIGTTKFTRYRFELAQFSSGLAKGDLAGAIQSLTRSRVYSIPSYA